MNKPKSVWVDHQWHSNLQNMQTTVIEQEKPQQPVVYDQHGNPWTKPRQPLGFDLSGKK